MKKEQEKYYRIFLILFSIYCGSSTAQELGLNPDWFSPTAVETVSHKVSNGLEGDYLIVYYNDKELDMWVLYLFTQKQIKSYFLANKSKSRKYKENKLKEPEIKALKDWYNLFIQRNVHKTKKTQLMNKVYFANDVMVESMKTHAHSKTLYFISNYGETSLVDKGLSYVLEGDEPYLYRSQMIRFHVTFHELIIISKLIFS